MEGRDWSRLHAEEFRTRTAGLVPAGGLTTDTLRRWREIAGECLIPTEPDPVAGLVAELRRAASDLTTFTQGDGAPDPAVTALRQEIGDTESSLGNLGLTWIEKNREAITLEAQRVRPEVDRLRSRVDDFETTREELLEILKADADAPELPAPPGRLVTTYCTNANDFWGVFTDLRLYVPRFVTVGATP